MPEFVAGFIIHNVLGELVVERREPENGTPSERRVDAIKRLLEQTGWVVALALALCLALALALARARARAKGKGEGEGEGEGETCP